jgi:alpha-L-fucosidase
MNMKRFQTLACLTAGLLNFPATPLSGAEANGGETIDPGAAAVSVAETPAQRDARMAWWREAKFGMFIHWGVYAVPARSGEWIMHSEKTPVAKYKEYAKDFNPVKYDPQAWAQLAKDAGMRYMVITSKHHDGFGLFPSDATTWDIADATPYKKDLLGPLAKAARDKGLKIGFYYSQAQDWTHPGGAKARYNEGDGWDEAQKGDFDAYLNTIAIPQTRELITRYKPDIFWWDTPTWMDQKRAKPLNDIVKTVPGIITNNRLGGGYNGDTHTPEQFVPVTGYPGDWETCMTIGYNWGYVTADMDRLKPASDLIRKLADICSKGGNFLLNVGPKPDGTIPDGMIERLREAGRWVSANAESIYGTSAGPFHRLSWGCATRKGDKLYLHVFKWPQDGKLRVPLKNQAKFASLLAKPAGKLTVTAESQRLIIDLPAQAPDPVDSVVVLQIEGEPDVPALPTAGAAVTASASQPNQPVANVFDGTGAKRWFAPKDVKEATLNIELAEAATISAYGFDEPDVWPRMNHKFTLEAEVDGAWKEIAKASTDGHGKAADITPVTAKKFRLNLSCEKGGPGVAELQLYRPE